MTTDLSSSMMSFQSSMLQAANKILEFVCRVTPWAEKSFSFGFRHPIKHENHTRHKTTHTHLPLVSLWSLPLSDLWPPSEFLGTCEPPANTGIFVNGFEELQPRSAEMESVLGLPLYERPVCRT